MFVTVASATLRGPFAHACDALGGLAARSPRTARSASGRTPCSRYRPEPRKGAQRRAGIRNLLPIPHSGLILELVPAPEFEDLRDRSGRRLDSGFQRGPTR